MTGRKAAAQPAGSRRLLAMAPLVLLAALGCTQRETVELSGFVQDTSGSRVPHAVVLITDPERNATEATTAGADGAFRLGGISPSPSYAIEVRGAPGFQADLQSVDLSADRHVGVTLEVEPIVEAIVISAPSPRQEPGQPSEARRRIRVGGSVRKARLVRYVPPVYPEAAERQGVVGTVLLDGVIGKEGRVVGLSAINSVVDERLVASASDAVLQWQYDPTLLNGRPVETVVTISVAFDVP